MIIGGFEGKNPGAAEPIRELTPGERTIGIVPLGGGEGIREFEAPKGATFLEVTRHGDAPAILVLVDPSQPLEKRRVVVVTPGKPVPPDVQRYVGQMELRFQVPIPRGMIIPAGVDPNQVAAEQTVHVMVFELMTQNLVPEDRRL